MKINHILLPNETAIVVAHFIRGRVENAFPEILAEWLLSNFSLLIVIITYLQHTKNDFGTRKQYCQYFQRILEDNFVLVSWFFFNSTYIHRVHKSFVVTLRQELTNNVW